MMKGFILSALLLSLVYAGEGHKHENEEAHGEELHEEEIHLSEEQFEALGIKLYELKKEPAGKLIKLPAEVRENLLTSYAIYSPLEGIVKKLYVKEGDRVKKGSPVAEIYSPELANLIGEVRIAKVNMESAKKIYDRDKTLYEEKVIDYTRYYTSMLEYERAKGEYEALSSKLKSFGELKGYHLLLRSPGSGYVVSQSVSLGESVGMDRELFEIHSHDVVWVYGWADEDSITHIKEGTEAKVISKFGNRPCKIDFIGHEVDRKTRRVEVRCVALNKKHILKPGMFVNLEVKTGGRKALMIPKTAVQDIEGKKVVFVRTDEGFEPREIKVLRELDGYYVVLEGLKEGEEVAVSGTVFLKTKLVGVEEGGHAH